MVKRALYSYKNCLILCIAAVIIGIGAGAVDAVFGRVLLAVTGIREKNPIYFLPFLPIVGGAIIFAYNKVGKNCIKGMNLIFQVRFGEEPEIPKRLIPFTILSTWATHLFGGSAGREGAAIQIGATLAHSIGKKVKIENASKVLLVSGMAAGFAGLFQTPVAAVFFALEVLVAGALEYEALLPAIIAAFVASQVSSSLGLEKFSVELNTVFNVDMLFCVKLAVIGILFGIAGGSFALGLKRLKVLLNQIFSNPIHKIVVSSIFILAFSLLLHNGRYSGLGTNIIQACFEGGDVYPYDWALKIIFTIFTIAAGFQGGEVTPLFSIGAALGLTLGSVFHLPLAFAAALGYTGVFASATNTFIGPVFIGAEVFGYEYLPYFFVVCAIAHVVSGNQTIYVSQRRNRQQRK